MADQTHDATGKIKAQPPQQQPAEPQVPQADLANPSAVAQRARTAPPGVLSPKDVLALQRSVGNVGVQTMLAQRVTAAERFGVWQPRAEPLVEEPEEEEVPAVTPAAESTGLAQPRAEPLVEEPAEEEVPAISPAAERIGLAQPRAEPLVEEPEEEPLEAASPVSVAQRLGAFPAAGLRPERAVPDRRHPPVLVPVDASRAGACVICRSKKFAIWINPTQAACTVNCMKAHEQKHIDDFSADANYKNKCAGVADGETFYYASNADAKRFEHPAIDLEIGCIKKQLQNTTDAKDKKILERRMNTTLPNYKASFTG